MGSEDSLALNDGGGKAASVIISCSICLDAVTDNGDRSFAKLPCGDLFHLDCIGSAFNAKGVMQCPNCRKIEKGQWLFANGSRSFPELNVDDWAHDEDLYDVSYSEMSFWCPYGGMTSVRSFDDGDIVTTAYRDHLGYHAVFSDSAVSSATTHPSPFFAYIGPIHSSSSNSNASFSEGPASHNNQWNSQSSQSNELPSSYGFPTMDTQYHSWDRHLSPFPGTSTRLGVAEQSSSTPSITQRATRTTSNMPRSGSYVHPFLVGQSSATRGPSSVGSSTNHPHPGSVARTRDRVQALEAYFHQTSNSSVNRTPPVVPSSRRSSSNHRGHQTTPLASLSSSDQSHNNTGFYFVPSSSGRNYQEAAGNNQMSNPFHHNNAWESETQFPPASQADRDQVWGPLHQPSSGPNNSGTRSSSYRQRSERMVLPSSHSQHHHWA